MKTPKPGWAAVKAHVAAWTTSALVALLHDLYKASPENRRFLHARLLGRDSELEAYRKQVEAAIYPDPLSSRPIRVGEAKRLIRHFEHASGDAAGTVDLLLTFVEAGTEQARDLGYGERPYFEALESALETVVKRLPDLEASARSHAADRVRR